MILPKVVRWFFSFVRILRFIPGVITFALGFLFFSTAFQFCLKVFCFAVNDGSRLPFLTLVVGHRAILYFHTHELQEEKICSSCSLDIIKAISNHFYLDCLKLKAWPLQQMVENEIYIAVTETLELNLSTKNRFYFRETPQISSFISRRSERSIGNWDWQR